MTTTLLASLALASTALSLTAAPAGACGTRPVRAFAVRHEVQTDVRNQNPRHREFVMLGTPAPDARRGWDRGFVSLRPGTYDNTAVAPGSAFEPSMTLTLLDDSGPRVITTANHVWFAAPFTMDAPTDALELDKPSSVQRPMVALAGDVSDAAWMSIVEEFRTPADRALGLVDYKPFSIGATQLRAVVGYNQAATRDETVILDGDREVRRVEGRAIGGMVRGYQRFLFVESDAGVQVVRV